MATSLTKEQFTQILLDEAITNQMDIDILKTIYSFDDHRAYGSQVCEALGFCGKNPAGRLNLEFWRYALRIKKKYPDTQFTIRKDNSTRYWDLFFEGWSEGRFWVWQLRPNLMLALEETGLAVDMIDAQEIPLPISINLIEGAKRSIVVNAYERNTQARRRCIDKFGCKCIVCGFDFGNEYGEVGKGFIHIHHLTPISKIGVDYEVNPLKDLAPICPNCHAMIHREKCALTIDKLKKHYKQAQALKRNARTLQTRNQRVE